MAENTPESEFSSLISPLKVPSKGRVRKISAQAHNLSEIAARLKVPSVKALSGEMMVKPAKRGLLISGSVDAILVRNCVLTLEPLEETVNETFEIRFIENLDPEEDQNDEDIDLEPLQVDQDIDLADLLVQQVALSMAPYPRKPYAENDAQNHATEPETSPFDVLKQLKNPN